MSDQHPATANVLKWFHYDHLPIGMQWVSRACHDLAHDISDSLPSSPELTAGLRHLLEAKDCFVRALVDASPPHKGS